VEADAGREREHLYRIVRSEHESRKPGKRYASYEAACSCGWKKRIAWHVESAARSDWEDHAKYEEGR
jgi:hypothetical protein